MKIEEKKPPRVYEAGFEDKETISDCGNITLAPDEQVTFLTESGGEYDVTRKSWGFYASPSTNGRLARFGLRAVLAGNRLGRCFVLLVEKGHEDEFQKYIVKEKMYIISWLDNDECISKLQNMVDKKGN